MAGSVVKLESSFAGVQLRVSRGEPSITTGRQVLSSTGFGGGFEVPLSGLLVWGGAVVLAFVLDWWDEADLAVEASEV